MRGRGVWPTAPGEPTKFAGPVEQHMAEGGGFEPPEGVNLLRFSRPPQSAALPSLRRPISWRHENGGASGTRTHVAAVQRRCSPAELWPHEKSKAASPVPTAPGRGTSEGLPEILRPPARCRRPRPRWQPFCLASAQTKPSRPQSRQRPEVGRGRCRSGEGRG